MLNSVCLATKALIWYRQHYTLTNSGCQTDATLCSHLAYWCHIHTDRQPNPPTLGITISPSLYRTYLMSPAHKKPTENLKENINLVVAASLAPRTQALHKTFDGFYESVQSSRQTVNNSAAAVIQYKHPPHRRHKHLSRGWFPSAQSYSPDINSKAKTKSVSHQCAVCGRHFYRKPRPKTSQILVLSILHSDVLQFISSS